MAEYRGNTDYDGRSRFAIVVSAYNQAVTGRLLQGAVDRLREADVPDERIDVVWAPGAWELPLLVDRLARQSRYASIIALGCVIRGETTHDRHINRQVSLALGELALRYQLPIPFGLLTCQNMEQALQRAGGTAGNKGAECAEVALQLVDLLGRLPDEA